MTEKITESIIATFVIQLLEHQGYSYVCGPAIAPDCDAPEPKTFDDLLRGDGDNPTIGILIRRSKNHTVVEYALRNTRQPIGVSEYELTRELPDDLKPSLPSIEQIEAELGGDRDG